MNIFQRQKKGSPRKCPVAKRSKKIYRRGGALNNSRCPFAEGKKEDGEGPGPTDHNFPVRRRRRDATC